MSEATFRTQVPSPTAGRSITKALKAAWREARTLVNAKRLLKTPQLILGAGRPSVRQPLSRFTVPCSARLISTPDFAEWLAPGERLPAGVDSFYLRPDIWRASKLSGMARRYPPSSGLKISKSLGDIYSPYMTPRSGRHLQRRFSGSHLDQVRTYNELYLRGIAPRLWDLLEIVDSDGAIRVGYVVDHVTGSPPDPEQFEKIVSHLRGLCNGADAVLVSGSGWRSIDFQLPDGNGNVITSAADGRPKYVDIHSFRMVGQPFPGASRGAGASSSLAIDESEIADLASTFKGWNLDLRGKLVISVSDSPDRHVAFFLDHGARWAHAFCKAAEISALEETALRDGHTRFSYSVLANTNPFARMVPEVGGLRASDIVVHLSIVDQSTDWDGIFNTPWSLLILEQPFDEASSFDALDRFGEELELLAETLTHSKRGAPVAISLFQRTTASKR